MCEPWFPEVDLVIDGAGEQQHAFRTDLVHGGSATDAFGGDAIDHAVAEEHIGFDGAALVHHPRSADHRAGVHLILRRILSTPRKASWKMLALILLVPFTRSRKVMGTSAMRKPSRFTRYFISIWNA